MSIPAETFFFDPAFEGTLQHQLQRLVGDAILAGRLRPGDKLPSSRKLATHLGVSRITVTLAYSELVSNGYLRSSGRSGYFVSEAAPRRDIFEFSPKASRSSVDWNRLIGQRGIGQMMPGRPTDWRRYPFCFIYGQADETLFDHRNWRLCALQALGRRDFAATTADHFERDDPELIKHISLHTLPRRGILARPEEILTTLGAQNALWLCAQLLLNQRRTAVMENPGYPGLRAILSQTRCTLLTIDVDRQGMQLEKLPDGADVVFLTPSHQCPTNVTMPVERRRELLAQAAARGYVIVEDDYEFEMSFEGPPTPALKSLDGDGRVIYVGSFSKSLFPGLRLGYIVAPEPFIREARALRLAMLRHPPGHIQRTVANFLSLGHYDALVTRLNQAFKTRRELMTRAIRENGLTMAHPDITGGGSSFWMRAPNGVDTRELAARLRAQGVLIEAGDVFFGVPHRPRSYFRLAYSSIDSARIPEGIELIARAIAATASG
jgi:GntR family transcriptional regulator / MocR family aminotransferase